MRNVLTGYDFQRVVTRVAKGEGTGRFETVPFFDAIQLAKRQQPAGWRPRCPNTKICQKILHLVSCRLGRNRKFLNLYVAIGTILDWRYGVDLFFEYCNIVVTIDLTTRKKKTHKKADIILSMEDIDERVGLRKVAAKIARIFTDKRPQNCQIIREGRKAIYECSVCHLNFLVKNGLLNKETFSRFVELHGAMLKVLHS